MKKTDNHIMLGFGKSAPYIGSKIPQGDTITVLTEHNTGTTKFARRSLDADRQPYTESYSALRKKGKEVETIPFTQTDDIAAIKKRILEAAKNGTRTNIYITTEPARGDAWMQRLLTTKDGKEDQAIIDAISKNRENFLIVGLQAPNDHMEKYAEKLGCPVALFDYYPGIGGMTHENGVTSSIAGTKDHSLVTIMNAEGISDATKKHIHKTIGYVTSNREYTILEHKPAPGKFMPIDLLVTNPLLHTCGMVDHISQKLIEKGLIDPKILDSTDANHVLETFEKTLDAHKDTGQVMEALRAKRTDKGLEGGLAGKGFYRSMSKMGGNVLITAVSTLVCEIRNKLIDDKRMDRTILDDPRGGKYSLSFADTHLKSKYAKRYAANAIAYNTEYKLTPGMSDYIKPLTEKEVQAMDPGEFIPNNPSYKNKAIAVPVINAPKAEDARHEFDGMIDPKHRFYEEELKTLLKIQALSVEYKMHESPKPEIREAAKACDTLVRVTQKQMSQLSEYPAKLKAIAAAKTQGDEKLPLRARKILEHIAPSAPIQRRDPLAPSSGMSHNQ